MINVAAGYRTGRAQGRSLRVAPAGARPPGAAPSAPAGARARSSRGRCIDAAPARIAALGHFRTLAAEGVEAVAVCYLHSYRSPEHERATAEALARALPAAYVSLSSDVFPQIQGVRAALHHRGQRVRGTRARALSPASRRAPDRGGVCRAAAHHAVARRTRDRRGRGPARGRRRALRTGRRCGRSTAREPDSRARQPDRLRHGGTSTDMSLIVEGEAAVSTDRRSSPRRGGCEVLRLIFFLTGHGCEGPRCVRPERRLGSCVSMPAGRSMILPGRLACSAFQGARTER